jgi:hypothetical protein
MKQPCTKKTKNQEQVIGKKQNKVVDPRFGGALFFCASLQSAAYLFNRK